MQIKRRIPTKSIYLKAIAATSAFHPLFAGYLSLGFVLGSRLTFLLSTALNSRIGNWLHFFDGYFAGRSLCSSAFKTRDPAFSSRLAELLLHHPAGNTRRPVLWLVSQEWRELSLQTLVYTCVLHNPAVNFYPDGNVASRRRR